MEDEQPNMKPLTADQKFDLWRVETRRISDARWAEFTDRMRLHVANEYEAQREPDQVAKPRPIPRPADFGTWTAKRQLSYLNAVAFYQDGAITKEQFTALGFALPEPEGEPKP